jgi:exodeoxyribonuclease VIII
MKTLIHPIAFDHYRTVLPGVSQSELKPILDCPARYRFGLSAPRKPSPAMETGKLIDHLVFGSPFNYRVSPYDDFRTKDAQAWKAAAIADRVSIFKEPEMALARTMVAALQADPTCAMLLATGKSQVAMVDDETGPVPRKALVDWMPEELVALVDLKTSEDASPSAFARSVIQFGYDFQAAWYVDLFLAITGETPDFVWIVQEKDPPHLIATYKADAPTLARGRARYQRAIATWQTCNANGSWPSYTAGITDLTLPAWAVERD